MEALIALQSKWCKFQIVAPRWHQRCHFPQDFGSLEAKVSRSVFGGDLMRGLSAAGES
jgi:hypothetical protein